MSMQWRFKHCLSDQIVLIWTIRKIIIIKNVERITFKKETASSTELNMTFWSRKAKKVFYCKMYNINICYI